MGQGTAVSKQRCDEAENQGSRCLQVTEMSAPPPAWKGRCGGVSKWWADITVRGKAISFLPGAQSSMELLAQGVGNSFRLMGLVSDVETQGVSAPSMVIRICFVSDNRAAADRWDKPFQGRGSERARIVPGWVQLVGSHRNSQTIALSQTLCPLAEKSSYGADERGDRDLCLWITTTICNFVTSPMIYSIFHKSPANGSMLLHGLFGTLEAWS